MKYFTLLLAFIFGLNVVGHAQNGATSVEKVRNTLKNAFELFEKLGTDSTAIYKLDSTLTVAKHSLRNAPTNPSKEEANTYIVMKSGLIQLFIATGKAVDAHQTIAELLAFARTHNDMQTIAKYEYYQGAMCANLNRSEEAVTHYQESVKTALTINDYDMAATSQLALATIYNSTKQFDNAIAASQRTIEYGKLNSNNHTQIGSGWHIIGSAYYSMEQYDRAIEAFEKAAIHYEKAGNNDLLQVARSSIDYILTQIGKTKPVVETIIASEQSVKKPVVEAIDTLAAGEKNSYEAMKTQHMFSKFDAADKQAKLEVLRGDYIDKQTKTLRARVWYISGLSLLVIVALILLYARQRQKRRAEVEKTQKYIDGLESERERISKELHDGVCNDLLAIELELKNENGRAEQIEQLNRSRESVRNISHELLPPQFQYATIDEILSDYTSRIKPHKISISYRSTPSTDWNSINKEVALTIYRIAQEALSNSIKHSGAKTIEVELSKTEQELSIIISDNGAGMSTAQKSKGVGLQTIKERVKSAGGELDINSSQQGTVIKATFHL